MNWDSSQGILDSGTGFCEHENPDHSLGSGRVHYQKMKTLIIILLGSSMDIY